MPIRYGYVVPSVALYPNAARSGAAASHIGIDRVPATSASATTSSPTSTTRDGARGTHAGGAGGGLGRAGTRGAERDRLRVIRYVPQRLRSSSSLAQATRASRVA